MYFVWSMGSPGAAPRIYLRSASAWWPEVFVWVRGCDQQSPLFYSEAVVAYVPGVVSGGRKAAAIKAPKHNKT